VIWLLPLSAGCAACVCRSVSKCGQVVLNGGSVVPGEGSCLSMCQGHGHASSNRLEYQSPST